MVVGFPESPRRHPLKDWVIHNHGNWYKFSPESTPTHPRLQRAPDAWIMKWDECSPVQPSARYISLSILNLFLFIEAKP